MSSINRFSVVQNGKYYEFSCSNYFDDRYNSWIENCHDGYEAHWGNWCTEDNTSILPGKKYRIFHQTQPKEGDVITHLSSGRSFTLGPDLENFITHRFAMIENGVIKAYLISSDYYKD